MAGDELISGLAVLIPFAGQGERLALGPKAILNLADRPVVAWIAEKAAQVAPQTVIAVPGDLVEDVRLLCPQAKVIEGGQSRQESVERLLSATDAEFVLIQDGARPFVSVRLMRRVARTAMKEGAAAAFLSPEVPVARIEEGWVIGDFEAGDVGVFQAPQAFSRSLLLDVHGLARRHGWRAQSTVQLALRAGIRVRAVEGEKTNIKITTTEDLRIAHALAELLK